MPDPLEPVVAEGEEAVALPYLLLRELLENPELLRPPPVILPRLGWEGRVTLLAAPEKSGKSTLLGQAVAALVNRGEFLGEATLGAGAFWLALDEPLGDVVRRLDVYGAKNGVYILTERPNLDDLESWVEDQQVGLVVIDTLTEFAAGLVDDPNSAMQWQPVLHGLRGMAQRTKSAVILSHHATKANGRYRDSSQIGAGVDAILEMFGVENDPTVRRVRARGRLRMGDFTLRFADPWYRLEEGELPVEMRTYRVIESNPGVGTTKLRQMVGGKAKAVDAAVVGLLATHAIEDRGGKGGHSYHTRPVSVGSGPGQGWDSPPLAELSAAGQGGSGQGQATGQAPLSPPYIHRGGTGSGGQDIPPCDFCRTPQRRTIYGMYKCPECSPDNRWATAGVAA